LHVEGQPISVELRVLKYDDGVMHRRPVLAAIG
jgi:hypothetical protein